jgi:tetratricopeptide (TPR) repeat protein
LISQNLGNESFQNKNFEKARDLYTQALELEKNHVYYSNRSAANFELGEFEESLKDAEDAIKVNSSYAKVDIPSNVFIVIGLCSESFCFKRSR